MKKTKHAPSEDLLRAIRIASDIKLPEHVRVDRIFDIGYSRGLANYLVSGIK